MHRNCLGRKQWVGVHLPFQELGTADNFIYVLISSVPFPKLCFHHADDGLGCGTVYTLSFHTVHEVTAKPLLTVLMCNRIFKLVVRADQLVVVRRENDLTLMPCLFPPFHNFQNYGGGQLVVKIVQVADIRLEVFQHRS